MFRYYCYLYRKLPKETENEITIDSDSSEQETKQVIDVVGDEFRIFKSKELRLEEIGQEAQKLNVHSSLFKYDPDDDELDFSIETAIKIHKRVILF